MAELKDVLAYILQNYPHRGELSNARVTKMVYLSDWKHVLEAGQQVSGINWVFDNYGPFVWDVMEEARKNPDLFSVEETANAFGSTKRLLAVRRTDYKPRLSPSERGAIDHVIESTKPLHWDQFIGLVYSTYPIVASERHTSLDLRKLASEYKRTPVYQKVKPDPVFD